MRVFFFLIVIDDIKILYVKRQLTLPLTKYRNNNKAINKYINKCVFSVRIIFCIFCSWSINKVQDVFVFSIIGLI